jgi:hypothetical protein
MFFIVLVLVSRAARDLDEGEDVSLMGIQGDLLGLLLDVGGRAARGSG